MAFFLPRISVNLTPCFEKIENKYNEVMDKVERSSDIPLRMIGTLFYKKKVRSFCPLSQSKEEITKENIKSLDAALQSLERARDTLLGTCDNEKKADLLAMWEKGMAEAHAESSTT